MFANNLKFLRNKYGMEQLDLALKLGRKSASSISEWESGKYTPKFATLLEISKIFNVDIDDMMTKDLSISSDQTYYTNPTTAKMAQEIFDDPNLRILMDASRDLEPDDLQLVIDMVKRMKKD